MAADEHAFDEEPIPGAMPERWETAIEDAAQVVALGLDRAQDLADLLNDFARQHPAATKLILAAAGGMIVGSLIAGRIRRRPPTPAERAAQLAKEIQANAKSTISDISSRVPSRRAMMDRLPRFDREVMAERMPHIDRHALTSRLPRVNSEAMHRGRRSGGQNLSQVRYAAQLLPVALTLLRNPLVRQLIMRSAARAARRS